MTKKIIIVVICLVTVCAVLGLNDRLTYDGLQTSLSMVDADIDVVTDTVSGLSIMAQIVSDYSSGSGISVSYSDEDSNGTSGHFVKYIYTPDPTEGGATVPVTRYYAFGSVHEALRVQSWLIPLERDTDDPLREPGIFTDVLDGVNYIAFGVSVVVLFIEFLGMMIVDVFFVVLSIVKAVFYLLGF